MDKRKQKSPQEITLNALRDKDLLFHRRKMWCVYIISMFWEVCLEIVIHFKIK